MEVRLFDEELEIWANNDNFYLDDVFKQKEYRDIYAEMMNTRKNQISFLNKTCCGNGGTTGLIRYALAADKGLLVLVPNVSICKSKENDYKDNVEVCCVYGGKKEFNPDAQVVIATYDQFPFLLKNLKSAGMKTSDDIWDMTFWSGRTIIVDEYHKLIDDSGYRVICSHITGLIRKVESPVIMMSATPYDEYIKVLRTLMPDRKIINYIVRYYNGMGKYTTRIDVYDVKHKDLKDIFKNMIDSQNNSQICVFFNNVKDIQGLLGQIGDDRCEVLCSAGNKGKVGKYYSDTFSEDKKLHFMTSAYFTGHDIWADVDKCVIIGSGDFDNMCLGERDIKQIIGRFRIKDGGIRKEGVQLFFIKKKPNQANYMKAKNTYEKLLNDMKILGNKWMELSNGMSMMHNLLRAKDALRRFDMWGSYVNLEKALTAYGFEINKVNTEFLKEMPRTEKKKLLSFKAVIEKLKTGGKVDFEEYPEINEINTYIEKKGMSGILNKKVTKGDIHNWFKAYQISQGKDLDVEKSQLPNIFGIETFGRYNAKYLNACLVFLDDESDYDHLSANMYDKMLCYAVPWKLDSKGNKQNHSWLIITNTLKNGGFLNDTIYRSEIKKPLIFRELVASTRISYQSSNQGSLYARTISLQDALREGKIARLKGIHLYDWVNEDKEHRLPEVKKTKEWKGIKKYGQTPISEMYKDTQSTYRYIKSEMDLADCLIIDIDGGLSFEEFQKKYDRWSWVAYPTISNVSENWTKFRVIVPLAHTIKLKGEHNLKVLKLLRTMFCPSEDPDHQIYSYINMDGFSQLKANNGELYNIPQEYVDVLGMCLKESYDYNSRRFEKKNIKIGAGTGRSMSLNDAKSLFLKALANPKEGARHNILYPIKKSLSSDDRRDFEDWLINVHPSYMTHWKSHKA